ncbi:trypsin-like peptidase domain-containing protein [Viridibacillus sp. FSL E2-0187]|uniref:S1C family serine protease n=1 Tax=Viridibacillus TaxID=496496 RepID=UPI00187B62B8|nr:trypsin-like peptidase domain-containing protein [Viridibacillus sp. JNUCC-6]QOV09858.1 trypsin-like peptidase domain-containing protein [Viridibacillus sp. JNUCC-6]
MGYYDNINGEDRSRSKKRSGRAGYFFSGLIGVIIGALLVWLLMPSMVDRLPNSSGAIGTGNNTTKQVTTEVTTDVTGAVEKVAGAVVGITNIQESTQDFWSQAEPTTQEAGSGSGVIYKKVGDTAYIVTNNHVVEGAKRLEVTLADGSKAEAKLIGSDVWTDLAVISISSKKVNTVATFGNSDVLKQGETVIAIGNPLGLDFSGSVTTGVVSGKDRTVPVDLNGDNEPDWQAEVLQTDAAINPGNSGGALVNLAGEVIGINSMKISESTVEGLGFAIPINSAIPVINELQKSGKVERPSMGVSLIDLTNVPAFHQTRTLKLPAEITEGIVISSVVKNSSAEKAGLEQYDVIVEIDGQKVDNSIELRKHLYNKKKVGDKLKVKAYRGGEIIEKELTLTNSPTS